MMQPLDPFPWQEQAKARATRDLRRRRLWVSAGEALICMGAGALLYLFLYACAFHSLP